MSSEIDIAWAAGLFEGEGCVLLKRGKRIHPHASMILTDLDVLTHFQHVVGCGAITTRRKAEAHHKDAWVWQVGSLDGVQRLADLFLPYLGQRRRAKFVEVLEGYAAAPVKRVSKTHCPHGHEFTPENTYYNYNRWRRCRECNRLQHRRQAEKKAVA